MNNRPCKQRKILTFLFFFVVVISACQRYTPRGDDVMIIQITSTATPDLPQITFVTFNSQTVSEYEPVEMTLGIDAKYSNPYDQREISVDAVFSSPDGTQMKVPGFWDGEGAWKIRFTPSAEGDWKYSLLVKDPRGTSTPYENVLSVAPSDLHGWIVPGNSFNVSYSGHYLVYHDGTPFYGIGHCDALNILIDGFDVEEGVRLFDTMKEANENYVVWWPLYTNSPVNSSYDDYSVANMKVIDSIVKDAEKEGIFLVFTIWDHPQLRDDKHPSWDTGNWSRNGFSKLSSLEDFFVAEEPWAWQENLYRYIIARWGYSPAIGMWQTVSEINGTNALDQTDPWHTKVNAYFVANDPYRHPTTASGSGEVDWSEGHVVMDAPQVHLYDWQEDAVGAAAHTAEWTSKMWDRTERPNWIGEFGTTGNTHYPELFHNSIWAALASGASMTPAEWNSGGAWGRMTPEMNADISRLAQFVMDMPLAKWNPSELQITSSDAQVRAWGVAGEKGGLFWAQDFSLEGKPIDEVRRGISLRSDVQLDIQGLAAGSYTIHPYDTWQGIYLDEVNVECKADAPCIVALPDFTSDMAFKIVRK